MCGINGIVCFSTKKKQTELESIIHEMNEKIKYRGPNHEGVYAEDGIALGMRRLSIQDLITGQQPIFNEDHSVLVVFNGEIYNFQELRDQLKKVGHLFHTTTDTEVIVHAYEEYGMDFLDKLDGMFAFAIFDKIRNHIVLARDRMGEKPCYYYQDEGFFLFGSELKSLMSTGLIAKEINKTALCQYLQLTYIPAPLSIFSNVYKLEPGHCLIIDLKGSVINQTYWNPKPDKNNHVAMDYEEAKVELQKIIMQSVKERMVSDVPIGAFLSGGIDSSSIVGVMSALLDQPLDTFTIGFTEKEYDERDRAKAIAEFNHTRHHEYVLNYEEAIPILDEILSHMDEPFADSSVLPTYFVSRFASEHVKVVLTGDAGDELFAGYSKYLIEYYAKRYKKVPKWIRKGVFEPIVYHMRDDKTITRKLKKVIENAEKDIFEQRKNLMCLGFKDFEMKELLEEEFSDKHALDFIRNIYETPEQAEEMEKTQYTDLKVVLEGDMLAKVDRMSMLNSLETRTPLLSRKIVEFAMNLPVDYKIKGKQLKRILKDAMKDKLPPEFDKYPKSGFGVPVDYWFRNQLKEELKDLLGREKIEQQRIFRYDYVEKIMKEHISGKRNRKSELWALYVFQRWYEQTMGWDREV